MNVNKSFSFGLPVRSRVIAEKVKGIARQATDSTYKGKAEDDTNCLEPVREYIDYKMHAMLDVLPPGNQAALISHLRRNGWR